MSKSQKSPLKRVLQPCLPTVGLIAWTLVFALVVVEGLYRFQIVDTYRPELLAYNNTSVLAQDSGHKSILVMGDSFTAGTHTYVAAMRDHLDEFDVVNSGISGTGIPQALILAPHRFEEFSPSIFVYQVYVGNDLFDLSYAVNWKKLSTLRNLYWTLASTFRSLAFINYRLGQMAGNFTGSTYGKPHPKEKKVTSFSHANGVNKSEECFSADLYTKRDKIYIRSEPWILENHVMVLRSRERDYQVFLESLRRLLSYCKSDRCKGYILVIPHCCQVHRQYLDNMKLLVARFSSASAILSTEYPFIKGIRELIQNTADLRHIQVLNPILLLRREEVEGRPVYNQNDSHMNESGQRILGKWVSDQIIRFDGEREPTR